MKKIILSLVLLLSCVFTVNVSAASDGTPPTIESIEVLTKEVAPGGKVKIKVAVSDDVSGVKSISLMFKSPNGSANNFIHFWPELNSPLSNSYILESDALNPYAEHGEWKLVLVAIEDHAGNNHNYHASNLENTLVQNISFTVDLNAPTEEVEIDDGFIALEAKQDVQLNKEFTITFNMDIDISTILERNIYVLDRQGSRVPLLFIIDRGQDLATSKVTVAPVGVYRAGSSYTLYIKDVKSTTGQILSQNTKMQFTTK